MILHTLEAFQLSKTTPTKLFEFGYFSSVLPSLSSYLTPLKLISKKPVRLFLKRHHPIPKAVENRPPPPKLKSQKPVRLF